MRTGLAFILWPFLAMFGYAMHANLLSLEIGAGIRSKVADFHHNGWRHFGHFVMLLGVPLVFILAGKFMGMLRELAEDGSVAPSVLIDGRGRAAAT